MPRCTPTTSSRTSRTSSTDRDEGRSRPFARSQAPHQGDLAHHADKATEVEQAKGVAVVEAATAKEATDAETAKAHQLAHDKLQSDFDASIRKFNTLKEKAAQTTGAKKQATATAEAEVTKREAATMASIARLRDATGAQWNAARTQVEDAQAALDSSITAYQTSLL